MLPLGDNILFITFSGPRILDNNHSTYKAESHKNMENKSVAYITLWNDIFLILYNFPMEQSTVKDLFVKYS